MTPGELFGTLQFSVIFMWQEHLKTSSYSLHMALDEYYKEMPEKIDSLIEMYQADHENITIYTNLAYVTCDIRNYLNQLKHICKEGYALMDSNELVSGLDSIIEFITAIEYKVNKLGDGCIHNNTPVEISSVYPDREDCCDSFPYESLVSHMKKCL